MFRWIDNWMCKLIDMCILQKVTKKYAFEKNDVPLESDYLEVHYSVCKMFIIYQNIDFVSNYIYVGGIYYCRYNK